MESNPSNSDFHDPNASQPCFKVVSARLNKKNRMFRTPKLNSLDNSKERSINKRTRIAFTLLLVEK